MAASAGDSILLLNAAKLFWATEHSMRVSSARAIKKRLDLTVRQRAALFRGRVRARMSCAPRMVKAANICPAHHICANEEARNPYKSGTIRAGRGQIIEDEGFTWLTALHFF
jgi:hypothetical protein